MDIYLNKEIKHFYNHLSGQIEINDFLEIVLAMRGAGKTTLINWVMMEHPVHWQCTTIDASSYNTHGYLALCDGFGLQPQMPTDSEALKIYLLDRFEQAKALGQKIVVFVDNAELLNEKAMTEILPLSRYAKLVFFATPQIGKWFDWLYQHQKESAIIMASLIRYSHLLEYPLLKEQDIVRYLKFRLKKYNIRCGFPFSDKMIKAIYKASCGNPYIINLTSNHILIEQQIKLPDHIYQSDFFYRKNVELDINEYIQSQWLKETVKKYEKLLT